MKLSSIFLFVFLLVGMFGLVSAGNDQIHIVEFYGEGCPHCAQLESFLNNLIAENSNVVVERYEVYFDDEDRKVFERMSVAYGEEIHGVPTVFIGNEIFVGFSDSIGEEIRKEVERCKTKECVSPFDVLNGVGDVEVNNAVTIPAVILAATVDAINPCAFAVLIILVTTILASSNRRKSLFAGLAFSASIFISYFLMGLGLYSAIQASGLTRTFYWVVAVLAIFIGLFNLKDYLWYGKWFVMEVPLKWRPKMKRIIKGVSSVPGAFLIGFLISLFLLPCTSGPYIVILGLLANVTTRGYATFLLILYNLIFILPMVLITLGIYFGVTTAEKAEALRVSKLKLLHLIAGIIILFLGIGMLIAIGLGKM